MGRSRSGYAEGSGCAAWAPGRPCLGSAPCGAGPGAQCSRAAGCRSSAVLSVRQRCFAGLVGQLALNEIIMDKYMKRLAQVSCLFVIDEPKCFVCVVIRWFCRVWGHAFCRTSSNPWVLWLTMVSETWFEAFWNVGMDFECCGDRWDFKICWKKSV